jgi:TatD DNase family protein
MLIDAHSHLDLYEDDLESALEEIREEGIFTVTNSTDPHSYRRNSEIAESAETVVATFGIHPWRAPQYIDRLDEFRPQIDHSLMLGEIGLDHYWATDTALYPAQRAVLEFFLAAARDQDKAVNLHTKGAEKEVLDLLDEYGVRRAIIHWYSGPLDVLEEMIDRGLYFTIGVEIASSTTVQEIARRVPAHLVLTETDNPGGQLWLTGAPGRPALIKDVVNKLAEVRGTSAEAMQETVHANFGNLVLSDPWLAPNHGRLFRAPSP